MGINLIILMKKIENKQNSLIRFEMNKDQLGNIVKQIQEIENKLASFSS